MKRLRANLALALTISLTSLSHAQYLSPEQALEKLTVAEGLEVKTFASDPEIVSISNIDIDHRGRVWACECVNYRGNRGKRPEGDRILILEDTDGDGVSDKTKVFYQGTDIDIAMGLCVLGNKAIVAASPHIFLLEDTDGDDKADKKTTILTSDAVFQHDHSLHSFVFGPDGRFYGNFGNTGRNLKTPAGTILTDRTGHKIEDKGKPFHGGMVFRCDRDFRNFEILGHNFRNNYEATVDSFGRVWQSDNDDDGNLAVRLNFILEGGNYGYLDELTAQRWRAPRIGAHPFKGKRHWHQNDPGSVPNVIETGNGAPTGVTIYEGDLLPAEMQNEVIFGESGGHVVWSLPVTKTGAGFSAEKIDILKSPDINFRPVDTAVAPDGSLVISDWYDPVIGGFQQRDIERGRLYWVAPKGHKYSAPKYDFETAAGAAQALRSPNYCARYLAWMKLHELGEQSEPALTPLLKDQNPRIRSRALFLLGQIKGKEATYIQRALKDADPEIRVVGLRLADLTKSDPLAIIQQIAKDKSPRVRAEAAVALRHHNTPAAAKAWATLSGQHDGKDRWYLEALGIGAAGKWDACWEALQADELAPAVLNDLIWRSRGTSTPGRLADLIERAPAGTNLDRYLRAFDFQPESSNKKQALRAIALKLDVPAPIALEAMKRTDIASVTLSEGARHQVAKRFTEGKPDATTFQVIKTLKLTETAPWLLNIAGDTKNPHRVTALLTLLELNQQKVVTAALTQSKDSNLASTIAQAQHPQATSLLLAHITGHTVRMQVRKAAARELAARKQGAQELLKRLEGPQALSEELKQAIAPVLLTNSDASVRAAAEKSFPLAPGRDAKPRPKLADLIKARGDAKNGQAVYTKQGQCATCHQVDGKGIAIGPDLSEIGTKLAPSALFEAILYPSAAISYEYDNYTATLRDGQSVTGVLVTKGDATIQMRDAEGNLQTLVSKKVHKLERLPISLMPPNLHQLMTTQELVDLVQYLQTLKRK